MSVIGPTNIFSSSIDSNQQVYFINLYINVEPLDGMTKYWSRNIFLRQKFCIYFFNREHDFLEKIGVKKATNWWQKDPLTPFRPSLENGITSKNHLKHFVAPVGISIAICYIMIMTSSVLLIKHIIHINSLVERFGVNGIKKDTKAAKQVLLINLWYGNVQYIIL